MQRNYINLLKTLPEIFDLVRGQETKEEKVKILKLFKNSKDLCFFVNSTYNVDWSSLSVPKFTPSTFPIGNCYSNINKEINRLESALAISKTDKAKAESLLTRVLESVSAAESELIVNMINGRKVDGISKSMFREVFPEYFRFQSED